MTVVNRQTLIAGGQKHSAAKMRLEAWFAEVEKARWQGPFDIKQGYASASFLTGNVIIFNIKGNHYRLVVK